MDNDIKKIDSILNYINKNISISKNIQYIINKIKELEPLFEEIDENNKIDIMLQIIENNNILSTNIQLLIDNKIISKITDEFVLSFKDAYCIFNNIEIEEEAVEFDGKEDNYKYFINEIRNLPELTKEERYDLLVRAKNGDKQAKDAFIEQNMKLVIYIANKYKNEKYEFLDLIQDGSIGLMEAIDKFDLSKGYSFSTYATWWIRQSITRALMNNSSNIRIPCHAYNDLRKIEKVIDNSNEELSDESISEITKLNLQTVKRLKNVPKSTDSIDRVIGDEDGYHVGDIIASDENIEESVLNKISINQVRQILYKCLQESIINITEYKIIYFRLGFNGETKTFQSLGDMNNVTKQRIEQKLKKAIEKIRTSKYSDILADCYDIDKPKIKIKRRKQ